MHVFEFVDAVTGESLSEAESEVLAPSAYAGDRALSSTAVEGAVATRVIALPTEGEYALRVDGDSSQRWFGCEATLPAAGAGPRRVRVTLVPRAREVELSASFTRDGDARAMPASGLDQIEVRADAASERELEVFRGACSGERVAGASRWCLRSSATEPARVGLSVRVPGYPLARVRVNLAASAQVIPATARFASHLPGVFALRAGASVGVVNGDGVGGALGVEVSPPHRASGGACPIADTCVRPTLHLGAVVAPYARETTLAGPGDAEVVDGSVASTYAGFEVGAGLTVIPAGVGDRLRFVALASMLALGRGEERLRELTLSTPAGRVGAVGEVVAEARVVGPLLGWISLRSLWVPQFGPRGRRFSVLGDATVSSEAASLVQFGLQAGLGVEL